jgi:cytidylate kinase
MSNGRRTHKLIGIVGPCGSGKSTLIKKLAQQGIQARHIAQEHSYVPSMWQRITNPDVLIFLDASYPVTIQRRKLNWTTDEYLDQQQRLSHARQHADFFLLTDSLTTDEVLGAVLDFFKAHDILSEDR